MKVVFLSLFIGICGFFVLSTDQLAYGEIQYFCDPTKIDSEWLVYDHKSSQIEFAIGDYLKNNPQATNEEILNHLYLENDLHLWYALRGCIESYGINPDVVSIHGPLMNEFLIIERSTLAENFEIPNWIRENANSWANSRSSDYEFANVVIFLSKTDAWQNVSPIQYADGSSPSIPEWIKQIVSWWNEEKISDQEMINSLNYLTDKKIIKI